MLGSIRRPWALASAARLLSTTGAAPEGAAATAPAKMSRWHRLKLERRAAPTPANRTSHGIEPDAAHSLDEAIGHMRRAAWARFDESVELVIRLNVDPRRADHNLRGVTTLPHGTGVPARIVAFVADAAGEAAARAAGVDLAGGEELLLRVKTDGGKCVKGFSVALAPPDVAPGVAARVGRQLGPKGLLPTAKLGTVVPLGDFPAAVKEHRRGKMRYRVDKYGSLHLVVGKMSFSDEQLADNILAAYRVVLDLRPATVKRTYVTKVVLCSTMGPAVQLDYRRLAAQAKSAAVEAPVERGSV